MEIDLEVAESEDSRGKIKFGIGSYYDKLKKAARRDGRLLDPLWRDLANDEDDDAVDATTTTTTAKKEHSAHYTNKIVLTRSAEEDTKLYESFRSEFSIFPIRFIPHQSFLEGEAWDSLLKEYKHVIQDPDVPTNLRADALDVSSMMNDDDVKKETSSSSQEGGLLVVPRVQFLFVELARVKEGIYDRSFRRKLEYHDIKTQTDRLASSSSSALADPSKEDVALQALDLLCTQWPYPSVSALKATNATKVLRRGFRSGGTETVRSKCQQLFTSWKDLRDLGEASKSQGISREDMERLRPILKRAGEALVRDVTRTETVIAQTSSSSIIDHIASQEQNAASDDSARYHCSMDDLSFPAPIEESESVALAFDKHGVVILNKYLTSVDIYKEQAMEAFEALVVEQLEPRGIKPDGREKFQLAEAEQRPGYRIDNRYRILDDMDSPITALSQELQREIPSILFSNQENNFQLVKGGVLHSLPGKKNDGGEPEAWHRDALSLFPSHHPAHCFTLYIPLVDLSDVNGALEFAPGTHMEAVSAAQYDITLRLTIQAGSILAYDARTAHHFLANSSSEDSIGLYFTFARDWFQVPETSPSSRRAKYLNDPAVNTKLMILSRLRQIVTGVPSSHLIALEETYGHRHYTKRFDLLLLDDLLSDNPDLQSVDENISAIVHFASLTEGDKETMAREFVYTFSQRNHDRKARELERGRRNRQVIDPDEEAANSEESERSVLYNFTALVLLEESILLCKLGFSHDEHGICCLLAMLKAHAARNALGCIGVTENQLEEAFTSWWHSGEGRFAFAPFHAEPSDEQAARNVLVVFSGFKADVVGPEWSESLGSVASDPRLDILHVLDPSLSMYCQDTECQWKGCDYYLSELKSRIQNYQGVMFLGDSVGASSALRFSALADRVLTFSPIIDILGYESIPRPDVPKAVKKALQEDLLQTLDDNRATIAIHYGGACKRDLAQIELLPKAKHDNVQLVPHDFDGRDLAAYLETKGVLVELVETEIMDFLAGSSACKRKRRVHQKSVLVGSF